MKKLSRGAYNIEPGKYYDTPKELWGFRSEPGSGSPTGIARDFLQTHSETLGLDIASLPRKPQRIIHSLGATHVIWQQHWKARRIHRAYVSIHIGANDNSVYLVKNRAAPPDVLERAVEPHIEMERATNTAIKAIRTKGEEHVVGTPELMWFPAKRLIHPAWRVRVHCTAPRAEYLVYVHAETGKVISSYDNLAEITGQAQVFLPNPMAKDRRFVPLKGKSSVQTPTPASYVEVKLPRLLGNGYLDGSHATTKLTPKRIHCRNNDFRRESRPQGGEETCFQEVSAYYHVDAAIAYLEKLGYKGKRRIFVEPIAINARGTRQDNSWYSPGERTLTFGLGGVDDAEDGETVLHEFGHAMQDAICHDFGQSFEAAAMGEGFGDYFAASFFESLKPAKYKPTVMSWDGATYEGDPPCVRRLDSDVTYADFIARKDMEHDNGPIWSAVLWEVRKAIGRDKADRIIIESHFQLDGFTTFARGARAILDANRNLFGGAKEKTLRTLFKKRGITQV
jgi:hypothetical protein